MVSNPTPPRRPRLLRATLLVLLILLLLLGAFAAWLLGTDNGARRTFSTLESLSGGIVQTQGIEGRLTGPLRVEQLTLERPNQTIVLHDLRLDWRPQELLGATLHLTSLTVGHVDVINHVEQQPEPSEPLPDDIGLPFALQVDDMRVEGGTFRRGPVELVELGPFASSLAFDQKRYRFELRRFSVSPTLEKGDLNARASGELTLEARKPYAIEGQFSSSSEATIQEQPISAAGRITLNGSLEQLRTVIAATINRAQINGHAVLRPLSDQVLGETQLVARGLDVSAFGPELPRTLLDIDLSASDEGAGKLRVRNAKAGPYNEKMLPLTSLSIDFAQQADRFDFTDITALLGSTPHPAGKIAGSGRFAQGALTLGLSTDALNLQHLDQRMRETKLAGQLDLRHTDGKQELTLSLSEPLQNQPLALEAHAILSDQELNIDKAILQAGKGRLQASAQAALSGNQRFSAKGDISRFRLQDIGDFPQLPTLDLNGNFSLQGMRQPRLEADLVFNITDSRLAGQPLKGEGNVQLRAERLDVPKFQLVSGANRLEIQGRLSEENSRISFLLDAAQLAQLGAEFGGALRAEGNIRGTLERPRIEATWTANKTRLPGGLDIDGMQGNADIALNRQLPFLLDSIKADVSSTGLRHGDQTLGQTTAQLQFATEARAPLEIKIQAADIASGKWRAENVALTAVGTTSRHTIETTLTEPSQSWSLQASGGLGELTKRDSNLQWQGRIDAFETSGAINAKLMSAADLSLAPQQVQLNDFVLQIGKGRIALEQFALAPAGISTRGRIESLQVAQLISLLQPENAALPVRTDLQLGGDWNLRLADILNGELRLWRDSGDITVLGAAPTALGLNRFNASVKASDGKLVLQVQTEGERLGLIDLQANTQIASRAEGLGIPPEAPLSGSARLDLPSLSWLAPLASPSLLAEGRLQLAMTLAGTVGKPELNGRIEGDALRVALTDLGIDLKEGTLRGEFENDRMLIQGLSFQGGAGKLSLSGPIGFGDGISAQLKLEAERFALLNRPDRRLVLSGSSSIALQQQSAQVQGNFTVDSGSFDIGSAEKPRLSEDVVIVGQKEKTPATMAATIDVTVGLGDGVKLSGRGLDAVLKGKMRLTSAPGESPQARGTLRIAKGIYSAYGRELNIEQGVLQFTGALDNPALDILAMKRDQEVAAGVSVRGTVLAPRVTLVSDPVVPEAEKLSWLVIGRGLSSAGEGDMASLQSAAGALLSKGAAAGVQSRIASAFGLDTFSVGSNDETVQERVVTLGKQISSRLYLGYQQGLESAGSVVQLRYQLTKKLSVEAETGARSALSLFYNIAFD